MSPAYAPHWRTFLLGLFLVSLGVGFLPANENPEAQPRETREIDGIMFEFSPQHEALVAGLVPKIAALETEAFPVTKAKETADEDDPAAGLSLAHFREKRDEYLAAIAMLSGQPAPSELQRSCYEEVLHIAAKTESGFDRLGSMMRDALPVRRVLVWDRAELIRRLQAGETMPGFRLPEDRHGVDFHWGFEDLGNPTRETHPDSEAVKFAGNIDSKLINGRIVLRGKLERASAKVSVPEKTESSPTPKAPTVYAIVLGEPHAKLSPDELVATVFEQNIRGVHKVVQNHARQLEHTKLDGGALGFLLLKETARIGLNERLSGRAELRWLSEGGARYIAWRTLHDRHPPETALAAYDIRAHLARVAAHRGQVNFATWKTKSSTRGAPATPLDDAHEAYAAMTFFVMAQRHGAESIPRFFAELGRTAPEKLNRKSVERAFRRTMGKELNSLLADVLKPAAKNKDTR